MSWNPYSKPYSSSASSSSHQEPQKGSAYSVISHGNDVLAAKKRDRARWWDHTGRGTPIFNNPGQYVFPGGGYQRSNNENTEAAIRRAAPQEFTEETGLDLDLPSNRIFMNYGNHSPNELVSAINPVGYYQGNEGGYPYGAVHMQVPSRESLNNIVAGFNRTSAWDNALHNSGSPYNKWKKDDELASLHVMPVSELRGHFENQNGIAYNLAGDIIPQERYRNIFERVRPPATDNGWFQNILNNRFPAQQAASSADSSHQKKKKGGHIVSFPPYLIAYLQSQ